MKYSILVIEGNNLALRRRIVSALTKEDFKVATAASSNEALLKQDELKPQLVILGEEPLTDSFEACSQLHQVVDVPILMVGIVPNDKGWTRAVEAGADFYLVKPFNYVELVARVKALLRRYEQTKNKNDKESLRF